MKNYLKLLQFLRPHRGTFILAVVMMFFASFFEGFQLSLAIPMADRIFTNKQIVIPSKLPEFVVHVIDFLNNTEPKKLFFYFPFLLVGILIIKNIFVFFYRYLMGIVAQRVMQDVRNKLFAKIQNLSLDYFSEKRTGELTSRITHDVNIIETALTSGLTDLFRQSSLIIVCTGIAVSIFPKGMLMVLMFFPLIGLPIITIGKRLRTLSKSSQEKMADITSLLLETISGAKIVKAFNTEVYEIKRFEGRNNDYCKLLIKAMKRVILLTPITEIVGAAASMLVFVWFGAQVMDGTISFGVFILFFGSVMQVITPIKKLGGVNAVIQKALAANDRIYEILDLEPTVQESSSPVEISEMKENIKIEDVDFHYLSEKHNIIKGVNLEIKKGEVVAIVGPTGVGKSTLVNLIPRFYDPTKGRVTIDGVDLKDVSFRSLRTQMGIVTQESILFNDSVKANIAYGQINMDQGKIEEAAKKAFAHRFIVKMPDGYDTVIGDRGFRLSGGEKQRISIARAILKNPPILILDEATSQLDSESEQFVQQALDELMKGRTVIAIAHRLSTIKRADKIVVLEGGRIANVGRHDDLMKESPLYQKLYNIQFQEIE